MSATSKPRYQQLKDRIIGQISDGELRPGDRVSSENQLAHSSKVSRMTANRALRELTDEGYVERIAGRGTFVLDRRASSHVRDVQNIADEIARRGHQHSCRVLRATRRRARGELASALDTPPGASIYHLQLVHFENSVPIQVEDRDVVASFAPACLEQDFSRITPSAYLTSICPLQEAEQVVRAELPRPEVRDWLQMKSQEPVLVVLRRTWARGRPVSFARLQHPGSRYELSGHYRPNESEFAQATDVVQLEALSK
ncbi:MAG TPA: histidine utilization repressor [Woeseiaceae bacterium]|nr:histidine utilization repressor [Woeseiaceae bacterium]